MMSPPGLCRNLRLRHSREGGKPEGFVDSLSLKRLDARFHGHDGQSRCLNVIPAQAGIQRSQNFLPQVAPSRIVFFNQAQFPCSIPFLELLLSRNR